MPLSTKVVKIRQTVQSYCLEFFYRNLPITVLVNQREYSVDDMVGFLLVLNIILQLRGADERS